MERNNLTLFLLRNFNSKSSLTQIKAMDEVWDQLN